MMFKKSQLGWRLTKQSLAILYKMKNIWLLVFLGRGIYFLIALGITLTLWGLKLKGIDINTIPTKILLFSYLLMLLCLLIGNIFSTYFNSAVMDALLQYDAEMKVSARSAINIANRRFWKTLSWINFQLTAGLFFILLFNQLMKVRRLHHWVAGLSWRYATFLVLPLIINENYHVFSAVFYSSRILKENVSEDPKINFSLGIVFFLVRLLSLIPAIIGYFLKSKSIFFYYGGIVITFLLLLFLTVLTNAILLTIQHAIYQWLGNHKMPKGFKAEDITQTMV